MPAKKGQRKNRKNTSRRQAAPSVAAAVQAEVPEAAAVSPKKAKVSQLNMAEAAAARYPYMRGELKRIAILSAAMLVLLVVLFVIFS